MIIAIACVVAVAAALVFAVPQMLKGSSDGGDGNNSNNNSSIENPSVSQIDGWWQSIGQSGSMYHHMVGGTDYMYRYDQSDGSSPSYVGKRTVVSFDRYAAGEIPAANEPCNVVTFDNGGQTFIQYDSSMDTLTCRNPDGSGYSGTSSLAQASNVPEQLLSFAEEAERWSGEPVEYAASAIDLQTGKRLLDDNVTSVGAFEETTVEIPEINGYEVDHAFLIVDGKSVEVQQSDGLLVFAIKEMPKDSALLEIYYRKTDGNRESQPAPEDEQPAPSVGDTSGSMWEETIRANAEEYCRARYGNTAVVDIGSGETEYLEGTAESSMRYVEPDSELYRELEAYPKDSSGNFMASAAIVVHESNAISVEGNVVVVQLVTSATQGNRDDWLEETTTATVECVFAEDGLIESAQLDGGFQLTGSV